MSKHDILPVAVFIAMIVLMVKLAIDALDVPVVQYSVTTKQCVNVLYTTDYTCDNLPTKYTKEWVR